ncbi:MAG TPA: hypothetical protein V6D26_23585 [Stenomitos sp.]
MLIQAFDPPLNFRPKTQSAHPEPPTPIDQDPNPIPSDIAAKIQELLVRGMPSTDILNALDSLSLPQPPIEVKPEPQVDNAIIKHLEALTQSITTLTQEVKVKVNQRIDAVETQVKQRPTVIQNVTNLNKPTYQYVYFMFNKCRVWYFAVLIRGS